VIIFAVLIRLPADYFGTSRGQGGTTFGEGFVLGEHCRQESAWRSDCGAGRILSVPEFRQGLLTIFAGLLLLDFPASINCS
jgi:hypothetical protein